MKKLILMISGILCFALTTSAQNEVDALRYSLQDISGTARFMGMGGAFGALGADMSAISVNPGSLGLYRRSEFGFSLAFNAVANESEYMTNKTQANDVTFGFNNIGFVGSYPGAKDGWERFNFAVAYNKLANFNETLKIQGEVENTSLLDVFVEQATGYSETELTDAFPFSAGLAYETYLINPTDTLGSGLYDHEIPYGTLTQTKTIDRSGSMGETIIAGGANFSDQIYFGASMGFPSITYFENSTYREGGLEDGLELDHYTFDDDLRVSGSGFNLKAGVVIKPAEWLRVGAAVHSPTWLSMSESYERSMTSYFHNESPYSYESPLGEFRYRLKTPARYLVNTGFVIGKIGVISADYEFVDYSQARFDRSRAINDSYNFEIENETIGTIYRGTHNARVGAEWRVMKPLRIRAGVSYQQNPHVSEVVSNPSDIITYSGGLGFRKDGFYIDVAYSLKDQAEDYYLYDPSKVDVASLNGNQGQAVISIGFRY